MTTFLDGPAKGATLMLTRAPFLLRVTMTHGPKFDALNQLDDVAEPGELLFAYKLTATPGVAFMDGQRKDGSGRRWGGRYVIATYALLAEQPDDATLRHNLDWEAWCHAQPALLAEQQRMFS